MGTVMSRLLCFAVVMTVPLRGAANSFTPDSKIDAPDDVPGDGICASVAGGACTLRAAIEEANALPGADLITLPPGKYKLTLGLPLEITDDLQIQGGIAQTTIIDGHFSPFPAISIMSPAFVAMSGLSIVKGGTIANIENLGTVALFDVIVKHGMGHGIDNGGVATLDDVSITHCKDGGFYNYNTATLTDVTISRNKSHGCDAGGGDVGCSSDAGFENAFGVATLTNVTISGNRAIFLGSGAGFANDRGGTATLTNVTFAGNGISAGGSTIHVASGTVNLKNTIVVGKRNETNNCTGLASVSQGHNIDSGNTCGFASVGDLINTDPLLDKLGKNGGFTQTHALLLGSPAIDAGDNVGCPATDQRGVSRPRGIACDIGAYEFQP